MNYDYLMAADMDLTLVMPAKDVSEANLEACRALKENGVAFTQVQLECSTVACRIGCNLVVGIFAEKQFP